MLEQETSLTKPKGLPDHPYYHIEKSPHDERIHYLEKKAYAYEFFYETADLWMKRDHRLRSNNVPPELKREAEELGPVTPDDVINSFNFFKATQIQSLAKKIARDYDEGKTSNLNFWARCFSHIEHLTLYDVWLVGTWDAFWEARGDPPPEVWHRHTHYMAKFDQVVSLVEEAMDLSGNRPPEAPKKEFPT